MKIIKSDKSTNDFTPNNEFAVEFFGTYYHKHNAITREKLNEYKPQFPYTNKCLSTERILKDCYMFSETARENRGVTCPIVAENDFFMKLKYIRSSKRNKKLKNLEYFCEDVFYAYYLLLDAINKKLTLNELVKLTIDYELNDIHEENYIKKIKNKNRITRYWERVLKANIQPIEEDMQFPKVFKLLTDCIGDKSRILCGPYCTTNNCNMFCIKLMNKVINFLLVEEEITGTINRCTEKIINKCLSGLYECFYTVKIIYQ